MQEDSHAYNTLRILSQSKSGYIGQCRCCDHYNFAFGNLMFVFTVEGLNSFHSLLVEQQQMHVLEVPLPNGKTHILHSPISAFMLSFDGEEIEEIKNLFQETLLILEVDRIFAQKE